MRKVNWRDHLIGFVVVVLGIIIAFQLNNYSNSIRQNKTVRNHFEYIKDETVTNKNSMVGAIKRSEASLLKVDSLLELLKQKGNLAEINGLMFQLMEFTNVYLRKNAYLTLTESGDIRWIQDYELKTKTINLYEYYSWTQAIESVSSNSLIEQYYPYVRKNMDFVNGSIQEGSLYFNKEFMNVVATYRYTHYGKINKYKDCLEQMELFLQLLEAEDL